MISRTSIASMAGAGVIGATSPASRSVDATSTSGPAALPSASGSSPLMPSKVSTSSGSDG